MNDLRMELKVCEGCGALWVRAGVTAGVYCRGCTLKLADFPAVQGRRARLKGTHLRCAETKQRRTFGLVEGGAR